MLSNITQSCMISIIIMEVIANAFTDITLYNIIIYIYLQNVDVEEAIAAKSQLEPYLLLV